MTQLMFVTGNVFAFLLTPVLVLLALVARLCPKRVDVGLGPEPLISYVYYKQLLIERGYSAETYVNQVYFITDKFDVRGDLFCFNRFGLLRGLDLVRLWFISVRRYRAVYHSFNGSPLSIAAVWRWLDPLLYKIAGVKVVILPYGGDVQELTRTRNLYFKHAYGQDYPGHRLRRRCIAAQIDRWTARADHIIGGCEWVDYMIHWDTLMLAHFAIDTDDWRPTNGERESRNEGPIRVLHAPNHRALKGTSHFQRAVDELRQEGVDVELVLIEGATNDEIRSMMTSVDIVADQLVVGWYAMFAIEAMSLGKPVLCYLRDDLEQLYVDAGLIERDEIPIANCTAQSVNDVLRRLVVDEQKRAECGRRSREFIIRHHSFETIGTVFDQINRSIGIHPLDK